jgi:hypothetical protein
MVGAANLQGKAKKRKKAVDKKRAMRRITLCPQTRAKLKKHY